MTITVEVTQDDIDHGRRMECKHCPVAIAVCRIPGCENYQVGTRYVRRSCGIGILMPPEAISFIRDFDCQQPVKPLTFELEIPE